MLVLQKAVGTILKIGINEIVLDEVFYLKQGQQVPTDCIIAQGSCEVNESLLTGESDAVFKEKDSRLISGSFLVSGSCVVIAEKVGDENYAASISNGAKYVKKVDSQILNTLNFIIKLMSIVIIPVGLLLFWRQFMATDYADISSAVVKSVAALIGMIPEGLML